MEAVKRVFVKHPWPDSKNSYSRLTFIKHFISFWAIITTAERTSTLPPASWRRPHVTPYIHYLSRYHLNNEAITLRLTEFYLFIRWSSSKKIFGGNLAVSHNFGPAVKMDANPGKLCLLKKDYFGANFLIYFMYILKRINSNDE